MNNEIKTEINVEFEEAPNRQEIQSGEEIKTLFGKLKKWLKDLKAVAFSGSYKDLTDKPNYAGSTTAGGAANSANKLNTNAGSSLRPVYFNNGIPAACSYNVPIAAKNTIDLTSGDYDRDTYYPVKSSAGLSDDRYSHISVYTALNTCKPSWSQHAQGYSAFFGLIVNGEKWGANWGDCLVYADTYRYCAVSPVSFFQTSATSSPVLYLRGGGKYNVTTDFSCAWTIYKDGFTDHNETVSPKTSRPAIPYSRYITEASTKHNGLMSAADKTKLDSMQNQINELTMQLNSLTN